MVKFMVDYTLCTNDMCPSAEKCYRYKAEWSTFRQAFAKFEPTEELQYQKCEHFIPLREIE